MCLKKIRGGGHSIAKGVTRELYSRHTQWRRLWAGSKKCWHCCSPDKGMMALMMVRGNMIVELYCAGIVRECSECVVRAQVKNLGATLSSPGFRNYKPGNGGKLHVRHFSSGVRHFLSFVRHFDILMFTRTHRGIDILIT